MSCSHICTLRVQRPQTARQLSTLTDSAACQKMCRPIVGDDCDNGDLPKPLERCEMPDVTPVLKIPKNTYARPHDNHTRGCPGRVAKEACLRVHHALEEVLARVHLVHEDGETIHVRCRRHMAVPQHLPNRFSHQITDHVSHRWQTSKALVASASHFPTRVNTTTVHVASFWSGV